MTLPKDPEYYRYQDDGSLAWVGCLIVGAAILITLAMAGALVYALLIALMA